MSSEALAERILRFVQAKGYEPREVHELARAMGIGREEQGEFHDACRALAKSGRVVLGTRNAVSLPAPSGKITGTYRANRRGFGFVIPDTPNAHGDLYIPSECTGGAMTGDKVVARVRKRGKRQGRMVYDGQIVQIVKRGQSRFVGEYLERVGRSFVMPDGNTLHTPIMIADSSTRAAKTGDQVVVELIQYPDEDQDALGVIVKVLGPRGRPDVDTQSIIEQYQFPIEFDGDAVDEARDVVDRFQGRLRKGGEAGGDEHPRTELRDETIITIDPPDAKDYDDAISLTQRRGGGFELVVHIADVSAFVARGGALDREARQRANSVYLPGRVIPMLPELLSNGVCSLQEGRVRLTKSVFIEYDPNGAVVGTRICRTRIRSTKRLTYLQADGILRGKAKRFNARVVELLQQMEDLARRIQKRRVAEGMLELDMPEAELVFDEDGRVVDVCPAEQSYPHKIIEMFMVEANEAVARTLTAAGSKFLRRIHDEPVSIGSGPFTRMLRNLGVRVPKNCDRFCLQKILKDARNRPEVYAINFAVLRSMQQAEYAPIRVGHFALASEDYCHFTSPIRRYPDLQVHRELDRLLDHFDELREAHIRTPAKRKGATDEWSLDELAALGSQCTACEKEAEAAERELKTVFILRLLEDKLGEEFDGMVTAVANVGLFVQLDRYLVEGLVHLASISDDWWDVDALRGCVIGQRSGTRIAIGDRVRVAISKVILRTRMAELSLLSVNDKEMVRNAKSGGQRRHKQSGPRAARPAATGTRRKPRRSAPHKKNRRAR